MGKFLRALLQLNDWFDRQKRTLPWRDDPSIYRVWVSEIMLQQTQVQAVIPYFEKFTSRFPGVRELAEATEEEVLLYWAGLGYYSRARNLRRGAQLLNGKDFPRTREEWLEVPGVGDYTAGAILSIALDQVEPILDGNIERVLSRVRRVDRRMGDKVFKRRLWRLAKVFVTRAASHGVRPSSLNQALMELGATVCAPRNPRCSLCPLKGICRASHRGEASLYPPKRAKKEWIEMKEALHCVLRNQGSRTEVLLRHRKKGEWRAGLWDLLEDIPAELRTLGRPGGQVETRHIVTRHRIQRMTTIWQAPKTKSWDVAEAEWFLLADPGVPLGSAARKTLSLVIERQTRHE